MADRAATPGGERPQAVAARGLTKRYGRVAALDGIDFTIERGEAVALWGPNGAGKTTILRCLLGLARYGGVVRVEGHDPARDGRAVRGHIGYVPQILPVPALTVDELAAFVARLKGSPAAAAAEALDLVAIGQHGGKPVGALSGGMKQRLALALALIGSPSILLLDEPTANLDARGRAELLLRLRALKAEGMTIVFSSHRPEDVLALADRVLLLDGGNLLGSVSAARFGREVAGASRLVLFLKNGHRAEAVAALAGIGLEAVGEDKLLTVAVRPHEKAAALATLANAGVELEDFELERGA